MKPGHRHLLRPTQRQISARSPALSACFLAGSALSARLREASQNSAAALWSAFSLWTGLPAPSADAKPGSDPGHHDRVLAGVSGWLPAGRLVFAFNNPYSAVIDHHVTGYFDSGAISESDRTPPPQSGLGTGGSPRSGRKSFASRTLPWKRPCTQ